MSEDRDLDSVVSVSADGISVEKRFERDDFAVPAVEFTLRSDRESPTTIRLIDHVPEEFPMEGVGFHPEYYNDDWTAYKDHRVEFERELSPGEELVTVYGVRLSDSSDVADFLGEPEIEALSAERDETPPDPLASITGDPDRPMDGNTITDIVSEEGNQVVRDVLTGDRDSLPGLGDDADDPADPGIAEAAAAKTTDGVQQEASTDAGSDAEADAGIDPLGDLGGATDSGEMTDEPAAMDDPLAEPATEASEAAEFAETVESPAHGESTVEPADVEVDPTVEDGPDEPGELLTAEPDLPATGNVASALAAEIREGSVSDGDLSVLRQELDVALPESTNVRIRHLQSRVEDLTAYTEALEGFIDDNGTASHILEEFSAFESEVAQLDDEIANLEAEIDDVQGFDQERQAIDDLETNVEALQADRVDTDERLEALEDDRADSDERLDTLEAEMSSISGSIEETSEQLQAVQNDLDDVRELESEVESIQAEVDSISDLQDRVAAVEDMEERLDAIDDLKTDVAAIRTDFGELEELVGANTGDLSAIETTLSNVEAELAGVTDVEGDLRSIDERLEALSESLESTEQSLESSVSDLQSEVETITDDVEEIRAWRDQLKGVFGAGDG